MKEIDHRLTDMLLRYADSGIEHQVDYEKFYLYSLITHSTAIEGSTVTEIENQLLFDEGIAAKGRTLNEQMMNVDLKNAYFYGFNWAKDPKPYTVDFLCELSARVMRRTGCEYSTLGGSFDSSKGELRLCNVSAGAGGRSYLSFQKVPKAISDFCTWLNRALSAIDRNNKSACYRLSFEAHFRLVTIHPWVDGNGRTTRLLMNIVQKQLGIIPSIVTKENKAEYIQALIDSREKEDSTIIQDVMMGQHIANMEARIQQYHKSLNDEASNAVTGSATPVYSPVHLSERQQNIIRHILTAQQNERLNERLNTKQISADLGLSYISARRDLQHLAQIGYIEHVGSKKTGYWRVIKE